MYMYMYMYMYIEVVRNFDINRAKIGAQVGLESVL